MDEIRNTLLRWNRSRNGLHGRSGFVGTFSDTRVTTPCRIDVAVVARILRVVEQLLKEADGPVEDAGWEQWNAREER